MLSVFRAVARVIRVELVASSVVAAIGNLVLVSVPEDVRQ